MKVRRTVYVVIGSLLILLNVLVDMVNPDTPSNREASYNIGYFIGSHILIIFGALFLLRAFRLHKKIKINAEKELENNIEDIGNN